MNGLWTWTPYENYQGRESGHIEERGVYESSEDNKAYGQANIWYDSQLHSFRLQVVYNFRVIRKEVTSVDEGKAMANTIVAEQDALRAQESKSDPSKGA